MLPRFIGGDAVDKSKIKYGVARIIESSFSFFLGTFGALIGILAVLAGIAFFVVLIERNSQWLVVNKHPSMLVLVAIVMVLALLAACGHTALSRTSRAAAYSAIGDVLEGTLSQRENWPNVLAQTVLTMLLHAVGLAVFVLLSVCSVYLVLLKFGIDLREVIS